MVYDWVPLLTWSDMLQDDSQEDQRKPHRWIKLQQCLRSGLL